MSSSVPIRILSVEDHPVFREGLGTIIGSQSDMLLVAQAVNAVEAVDEFRRHRPDVTLMDLRLPGANGTDTLIAIRGEFPQARSKGGRDDDVADRERLAVLMKELEEQKSRSDTARAV